MVNSHESTEQAPIAVEDNTDYTNQQEAQTRDSGNPDATRVSVVSPQKHDHLPHVPDNILGSLGKKLSSNPPSRSSRKRMQMEAQLLQHEVKAEVEKKQMEIEFRRKQRELELQQQRKEMELASQREEMELAEMKRQQALSLKLKKLELADQASSRGSVSSASASVRFWHGKTDSWVNSKENNFDYHLEDALDDKPAVYDYNEPPCSSKQADARMKGLETPNPSARSIAVKPKSSLKFDANVFVPSSAYAGAVKPVVPTPVPSSALPLTSTPAFPTAVAVSIKLPKLVLDKFDGDPLEWLEWAEQFLATFDESGLSDSNKMEYLKLYLKLWQSESSHWRHGNFRSDESRSLANFGAWFWRPELVVNAQLRKIDACPFIKSQDSLEIVRYSHIVSACVVVLNQYGYESDINSESVLSSAVRKILRELQNMWMTYVLNHESIDKNLRRFSAWLKKLARVEDNIHCQNSSNFLLHSEDKKPINRNESNGKSETANNADAVLTANSCSASLQIVPITLSSGNGYLWYRMYTLICGQESQGSVGCPRELNYTQHCSN